MTRQELAELLGEKRYNVVKYAVQEAAKEMPSIAQKQTKDRHARVSFTKEEILFICTFIRPKLNPVQIAIIGDNYIEHKTTFVKKEVNPYIEGTEKFLTRIEKDPKFKCCANCIYIRGKNLNARSAKVSPYCAFYNKYISRIIIDFKHFSRKASPYKDHCESYRRGPVKVFYKSGY